MSKLHRIAISVTTRQLAHIERVRIETGASVAEIIRRLLDKAIPKAKP